MKADIKHGRKILKFLGGANIDGKTKNDGGFFHRMMGIKKLDTAEVLQVLISKMLKMHLKKPIKERLHLMDNVHVADSCSTIL